MFATAKICKAYFIFFALDYETSVLMILVYILNNICEYICVCVFQKLYSAKICKVCFIFFGLDYKSSIVLILKYIRPLIYLIIFLNNIKVTKQIHLFSFVKIIMS